MNSIAEIKEAITHLPQDDLAEFRKWFAEFEAEAWDRQMEGDVAAAHSLGTALSDITKTPMPIFKLKIHKTYYEQGFFNVLVDFDRFVRISEGEVELVLGASNHAITGKINRTANQ